MMSLPFGAKLGRSSSLVSVSATGCALPARSSVTNR